MRQALCASLIVFTISSLQLYAQRPLETPSSVSSAVIGGCKIANGVTPCGTFAGCGGTSCAPNPQFEECPIGSQFKTDAGNPEYNNLNCANASLGLDNCQLEDFKCGVLETCQQGQFSCDLTTHKCKKSVSVPDADWNENSYNPTGPNCIYHP